MKEDVSASDRVAYLVATGAGAGFSPIGPGTVGALEAVVIFLILVATVPGWSFMALVILDLFTFAAGVWSANRACAMCGLEDPGQVVIDEVNGQLIALTPLAFAPSAAGVVTAFVLFRLFDIFKPYPINKLERLRAGWGVMSDDALAGLYSAALVWLGLQLRLI